MDVLKDMINENPFVVFIGKRIEISLSAGNNQLIGHGLDFTPTDAIILSVTNGATVSFDYDSFDDTYIQIDVSAATTVRMAVGKFGGDT
jgi:hypothetical protein